MKTIVLFPLLATLAASAVPEVTGVKFTQPRSGTACIAYTLVGEPAVVTIDVQTNGCSIGGWFLTNMTGAVNRKVEPGTYTNVWRAFETMPEMPLVNATAVVTAWPTNDPPPYLVADLRAEGGEGVRYYASTNDLPGGFSDPRYRLNRLLMRKCPVSGSEWLVGSPASESNREANEVPHRVAFSGDFYMGVFQITQGQYTNVVDAFPSPMAFTNMTESAYRPMNYLSYGLVRGSAPTINWPTTGSTVGSTSTIKAFRDRTGLKLLDLPTEAQWEVACRAGTETPLNSGKESSSANVAEVAWFSGNVGKISFTISTGGTVYTERPLQQVGTRAPNAWGLYDMHGNGREFCLDWYFPYDTGSPEIALGATAVDPVGPENSDVSIGRVSRGGNVSNDNTAIRSARRWSGTQGGDRGWNNTFRFACPAIAQ